MATFSTNQVRQLYVALDVETSGHVLASDIAGTIALKNDTAKNHLYFEYKGADNLMRSDLIDIKNILYVKATAPEAMARDLKSVTVALDSNVNGGTPVAGQDYILRIAFRQYVGMSDEDQYFKYGMVHAYAAAKAYAGMTLAEFDAYVKTYAALPANGFKGMTYGQAIYKPMLEVFEYLKAHDFTYYVVSGSDRFICRALAESIGIPANRVIGMDVKLASNKQGLEAGVDYTLGKDEHLVRTSELIIKNLKTNKVLQISQEIGKVPVLSFGNSSGDCAMHNYCLSNSKHRTAAFMLVADDDQRDHANLTEAAKREAKWRESGYYVISMKNDFRTIYGNGVEKTDFHFE